MDMAIGIYGMMWTHATYTVHGHTVLVQYMDMDIQHVHIHIVILIHLSL